MKRILASALALLLILSPALCLAEDNLLGGILRLEKDKGYTMTYDPSDELYEITGPDGTIFMCGVQSIEETGMTEALFRMILPSLKGQTQEGLTYGDTIGEHNGFMYIPISYYGFLNGYAAIGCESMLFAYILGNGDAAAFEALLDVLGPADAEEAEAPDAAPGPSAALSIGDVTGFYDLELLGERNTDITLILTPGGYGRMSNSTSSITFDYEIRDGQIVPDTDEDISITLGEDGSVTFHYDYLDLVFVKRESVAGSPRMTGRWKATQMSVNGATIESALLEILGLGIDFTAYDDGTVDWHSVSDSEDWIAQGWGIDEEGLYLYNGRRNPCTLEDGVLTFLYYDDNSNRVVFTYVGPVE